MNRYQVYLNPSSVAVLDQFEELSRISRSQLIRSSIDRLASQLAKVVVTKKPKTSVFDRLIGCIDLKTSHTANFSQTVDEIYSSPA